MGLKQIIREKKIMESGIFNSELVLPGEPGIYSIKYNIGMRKHTTQYFRNMRWKSLLKCIFRAYYNTKIPVVLVVRFYVSPPSSVSIKASDLKKETIPATMSFEVCDYLLSLLEMLHHVLVNSYRQFVKIDVEKYYSSNPRTVFKFMKWDHYVHLQNNSSLHSKGESFNSDGQTRPLQSKRKRNESAPSIRPQNYSGIHTATVHGGTFSDCALQDTGTAQPPTMETDSPTLPTPH